MNLVLFLVLTFFTVIPGVLLLAGAIRFRNRSQTAPGILILIGSVLVLGTLIYDSRTYFYSSFGYAEQLADHSIRKALIRSIAQFLGICFIAVGLLVFRKENS